MNKKNKLGYKAKIFLIFAGPSMIMFTLVVVLPMIYGVYLTLTSWDGISSVKEFVGIENYIKTFRDAEFLSSLWLTIKYVVISVITVNVVAFALAYLLTSGIRGQNFLRAGFFTPNLIGGIVLGFIWQFIFSRVMVNIGDYISLPFLEKSWLSNPTTAFIAMVIVTTWQQSGYMLIIYISGFVGVPQDYIEAAMIDGATASQITRKIRIPLMAQSFVVCLFLTITSSFKVYDLNLSLTDGGPYGTTEMAAMHIFRKAFEEHKYGEGQAEAMVLFVIMIIVAMLQVYIGKKREVEA